MCADDLICCLIVQENCIRSSSSENDGTTIYEGIRDKMGRYFDFIEDFNQPFLVKKSERTYILSFFHVHVWKKR